jgi:hypothetical protein
VIAWCVFRLRSKSLDRFISVRLALCSAGILDCVS